MRRHGSERTDRDGAPPVDVLLDALEGVVGRPLDVLVAGLGDELQLRHIFMAARHGEAMHDVRERWS
jgi:hypothetical protein